MGTLSTPFVLIEVNYFSGKAIPKDVVVNHRWRWLQQSSPFITTQKKESKPSLLN